ncbi:MAG: hypothetical protein NVSMB65_01570 [Chloroflexota bacterium]
MMPGGPADRDGGEDLIDVLETDYFAVSADPAEETISIAFFERNLIMEFTYEELLDFAEVVDRSRTFIEDRTRQKSDGRH